MNLMSPGNDVVRASYRDAGAGPQPLEPGKVYELRLPALMTSIRFARGHRIRAQISASFAPHMSRNLQTGESEVASVQPGRRQSPSTWKRRFEAAASGHGTGQQPVNRPGQVLFASLVGTTIEFFDFYIYATAAVLAFPACSFRRPSRRRPRSLRSPRSGLPFWRGRSARRCSVTSETASAARPRSWRRSYDGHVHVAIGALPTYQSIRLCRPAAAGVLSFRPGSRPRRRMGRRRHSGDRECAPGKRAWYGMFPQLGAPLGFFLSDGVYIALSDPSPTSSSCPSAGGCRSSRARCSCSSDCTSVVDRRDTSIPPAVHRGSASSTPLFIVLRDLRTPSWWARSLHW